MQSNALARQGENLKLEAIMIEVKTPEELIHASTMLKGMAQLAKKIREFCEPNIKRWYEGHKAALREQAELLAPVEDAESILGEKIVAYRAVERRVRELEEAEARRLAAENAQAERDAQVASLKEVGLEAEAEVLESSHLAIPSVQLPPLVKTEGVHTQRRWSAEVTDKLALVKFVAANPMFLHLLDVNKKEANAIARAQNENLAIPGLRAVAKESTVVRTG